MVANAKRPSWHPDEIVAENWLSSREVQRVIDLDRLGASGSLNGPEYPNDLIDDSSRSIGNQEAVALAQALDGHKPAC